MKDYFLDENHINADTEIDLVELFFTLLRHWKMVLCSALAGGILFCAYTMFLMTPMYTSTSSVLILTKETTLASLADLQMGSQLTNDYSVLITSRPVLEDVIKNLKLDMEYRDLANCISVNNPTDTRILEISVTYPSATQSAKIVNELTTLASDFIGDMMEGVPPKVIETGEVPDQKTSPSVSKNTLIGVLIGLVLSCGIVTANMLMDDTIKSEDDVMHYLGIPTLASIPDRKDYVRGDKKKKRKWKFWQSKKKPYSKKKKADTEETK